MTRELDVANEYANTLARLIRQAVEAWNLQLSSSLGVQVSSDFRQAFERLAREVGKELK